MTTEKRPGFFEDASRATVLSRLQLHCIVVDGATADGVIHELQDQSGLFERVWKDPTEVATREWRAGALEPIADPEVGSDGTILVELKLNHPHPEFAGIVRIDAQGIWYADGDGSVVDPVWRLRLLPWRHLAGITLPRPAKKRATIPVELAGQLSSPRLSTSLMVC